MTDDLVQFLRDRYDEDEQAARHAAAGPWTNQVGYIAGGPDGRVRVAQQAQAWNAGHIARHDPARVLADIDAKRQVLDLHGIVHRDVYWLDEEGEEGTDEIPVCGHCVPRHSYLPHHSKVPAGPCATVRLLALSYADHPDYRDEWRP